jgi:hypothetical protein
MVIIYHPLNVFYTGIFEGVNFEVFAYPAISSLERQETRTRGHGVAIQVAFHHKYIIQYRVFKNPGSRISRNI